MPAAKNATDAKTKAEAEGRANATVKKSGADDGWLSIADVVRVQTQSPAPTGSFEADLAAIRTPDAVANGATEVPPREDLETLLKQAGARKIPAPVETAFNPIETLVLNPPTPRQAAGKEPETPSPKAIAAPTVPIDPIAAKYGGVVVTPPRNPKVALPPIGSDVTDFIARSVPPPNRPTTGYEWQTTSSGAGRGELSVTNGTGKDGVVVLFERLYDDSLRARRAVYVRAHEDTSLHGIAPGTYTLRFMLGVDWNHDGRVFQRGVEGYAFVDALDFTETKTDSSVVYSEQSVTLHKVINGNARSTTISPAMIRFDELPHDGRSR
jgi:hypothetical protein